MKTCFSFITMIVVLTVSAWGQNASMVSSDPKELGIEMEMMSGFISYVLRSHFLDFGNESQSGDSPAQNRFSRQGDRVTNGSSWIDTSLRDRFYLQGQGAVFIIPVSSLRTSPQFPQVNNISTTVISWRSADSTPLFSLSTILEEGGSRNIYSDNRIAYQVPGESASILEEISKTFSDRLKEGALIFPTDLQEPLKRLLEQFKNATDGEQPFLQALDSVREPLANALAQYGDSMYAVKPDEYINLVFQKSPAYLSSLSGMPGSEYGTEVISVRKSWITDYKAGKMTLEEFRKKVLQ